MAKFPTILNRILAHRRRKALERNERLRREVIVAMAAAGGRAAQRKRREPVLAKCRQMLREMGKPIPEVLS